MKNSCLIVLGLAFGVLNARGAAEKKIITEVSEVTVFLQGAQVTREKHIDLSKGITMIRFTGLSPFIDARSIQVKATGNLTVLSVNHAQNYLEKSEKSEALKDLTEKLEAVDDGLRAENAHLGIIQEELAFLYDNRDIGGRNDQVNVAGLQQASDFYSKRLTSLKMEEIERNGKIRKLNEKKADLQNQIRILSGKKDFPTGEILVKVDAEQAGSFPMELSYLVGNAGWFPSYDIRATNIEEPIELVYKANVKQDTKVDWKDVKLRFSSADPNVSGVAPELKTYYLSYNTLPPVYRQGSDRVRGRVFDESGQPLPGANVVVEGTTVGTVTDMEGNYSITLPNGSQRLSYSYIGYNSQTLPVSGQSMNVVLRPNNLALNEVAVTGYGNPGRPMAKSAPGAAAEREVAEPLRIKGTGSLAIPTEKVENQTTVDFEIRTPYTVLSDNKSSVVDMEHYALPAIYQYYSVPKIDKDAFLIAGITDWEKYNLLEGETNIFFENTYVGKSILDVRYATDTLEISLGRDKNVVVKRDKIKDFTGRRFMGSKKEETRAWRISVKNNKSQEIDMILLDQVPVSTMEEIEVSMKETSGAELNRENGEIRWEFTLSPSVEKQFDLVYSVKFPKGRNLVVE